MKETDKIHPADKGEEELLHNVRHILQEARAKVIHHVNSTLVRAYWQVGKYIVEYEQQGTGRAGYGKAVINTLSRRLVAEFGNGFTATNLRYMRQFYQCYPKYHTLCDKLSWSHCRTLLKVSGDAARDFTCTSASRKTGVSGSSTAKSTRFSMTACWPAETRKP